MRFDLKFNYSDGKWQSLGLFWLTISLILWLGCQPTISLSPPELLSSHANLAEKVDYTLELARYKLYQTIPYIEKAQKDNLLYPTYTENHRLKTTKKSRLPNGYYHLSSAKFWASGAFAGLIWQIYQQESDEKIKRYWLSKAKRWSQGLYHRTEQNVKDMTINNLFAFRPWYQESSNQEKEDVLGMILAGAKSLSEPLNLTTRKGQYSETLGVMGYFRRASRTDKKEYWQAFVDHSINVEQLLWAAQHTPNQIEANRWNNIALSHIKSLAQTMSKNRNPGQAGTWQRGYFEVNPNGKNYGKFLFNEGKQGWKDGSTWSRGQAWWIYATSVTYQYSQDPEILTIAKQAINYYLNHLLDRFPNELRQAGDLIPPWDFDYALQVDPKTEKDTSAAAIAVSGMLKLVASLPTSDPDRKTYLTESERILNQLLSPPYLATPNQGMSVLLQGCYHHPKAIAPTDMYDNGLIWGDYFLVDALITYQTI
jgi:hypothetical protein